MARRVQNPFAAGGSHNQGSAGPRRVVAYNDYRYQQPQAGSRSLKASNAATSNWNQGKTRSFSPTMIGLIVIASLLIYVSIPATEPYSTSPQIGGSNGVEALLQTHVDKDLPTPSLASSPTSETFNSNLRGRPSEDADSTDPDYNFFNGGKDGNAGVNFKDPIESEQSGNGLGNRDIDGDSGGSGDGYGGLSFDFDTDGEVDQDGVDSTDVDDNTATPSMTPTQGPSDMPSMQPSSGLLDTNSVLEEDLLNITSNEESSLPVSENDTDFANDETDQTNATFTESMQEGHLLGNETISILSNGTSDDSTVELNETITIVIEDVNATDNTTAALQSNHTNATSTESMQGDLLGNETISILSNGTSNANVELNETTTIVEDFNATTDILNSTFQFNYTSPSLLGSSDSNATRTGTMVNITVAGKSTLNATGKSTSNASNSTNEAEGNSTNYTVEEVEEHGSSTLMPAKNESNTTGDSTHAETLTVMDNVTKTASSISDLIRFQGEIQANDTDLVNNVTDLVLNSTLGSSNLTHPEHASKGGAMTFQSNLTTALSNATFEMFNVPNVTLLKSEGAGLDHKSNETMPFPNTTSATTNNTIISSNSSQAQQ